MNLRWRLALLIIFATGVPVLTGVFVTRQLVGEILDVGLSPQLDAALEAGVRQARDRFQAQRLDLDRLVARAAAGWRDGAPRPGTRRHDAFLAALDSVLSGDERVIARAPDGRRTVLREGAIPESDGTPPSYAPPLSVASERTLSDGWTLEIERPVPPAWRDDAMMLAESLQMVRGLRLQQAELERMYGIRFLAIFLLALAVGLALAWHLSLGITEPVRRLVKGTEDVAEGRWDVRVPVLHRDELGRLTERFNTMVRTLELQSRRLVDLEKMEGWREMARALAHEVKNPLTPIQLTVEEMRARYPGGDARYEALLNECARIVVEEVESLRAVVARFREFSRPVELEPVPTDVRRLVGDVAALQRDLHVETEMADELEDLPVDPDRLRQVLMNLAANAREATRDRAEPRLAMSVSAEPGRAVITVEDNGPGVPPDQRERIFEPYRSGRAGGLGLGLALVKGIVLAHGGDISVDTGRWQGARFIITLPRSTTAHRERDHA